LWYMVYMPSKYIMGNDDGEREPLLDNHGGEDQETATCVGRHRRLLIVLVILLCWAVIISALVVNFVVVSPAIPTPGEDRELTLVSLSVWGSPASFGTLDKEERIQSIGEYIVNHTSVDLFLLQELWMRPDHETIRDMLQQKRADLQMTAVGDLAPALCDGRVAPTFCSGLAVVSRFPIKEVVFTEYSAHGYIFYRDGEYWARKGTGRVRVETVKNYTVDVFLTSTCAFDYNTYYRQIQAHEFANTVSKSSADFIIAAGDFNIDPRTSETTYASVKKVLRDTRREYFGLDHWLNPRLATYGNNKNTYSQGESSLVYDYFWHKARPGNSITVKQFLVPILKTRQGHSFSNHEAVVATFVMNKSNRLGNQTRL